MAKHLALCRKYELISNVVEMESKIMLGWEMWQKQWNRWAATKNK